MLRRIAPTLALIILCLRAGSPRADVPAELLQAPPAAAAPSAADLVGEVAVALFSKAQVEKLGKITAAQRAEIISEKWTELAPHERATLEYAAAHFRESGTLLTDRTVAIISLSAPVKIYDEASRDWTGSTAPVLSSPVDLEGILKPAADAPALVRPTSPLTGSMPTQAWVYPGATVNDQRVVWFVDEGSDGTWRFVKDEKAIPVTTVVSTGGAQEMPAELFPAAGLGEKFDDLPVLTEDALPLQVSADNFKAAAGRTFVRLMPQLNPAAIDLELGVDPAAYKAGAVLWLRVEKDGAVVHQASMPLSDLGAGEPWLAEFGVPLGTGIHHVTALVIDKGGKGGKKVMDVDVPTFGGAVALSSVVLAKADAAAGEAGLPKAKPTADGSLAPFQIGNYTVVPQVPPVFKRGDTIALVVQVYGSSKATVEYDLYREGSYQSTTDPEQLNTLPVTDIQQFTVTPEYTDGAYEFHVTAKSGGTEATRKVSFRIKG